MVSKCSKDCAPSPPLRDILHLWGTCAVTRHTLDTHLLNLRKKVPPFAEKLVSVYGTGYCYEG